MIGMLEGKVGYKDTSSLIIDVCGVGYKVLVSTSVLAKVLQIGQSLKLFTHTHVREDLLELYGFWEMADLQLFENLISVSGIGCKTALNIFSIGSREEIIKAISSDDVLFFSGVPRLGKKNAQKIIIELKNKISGESLANLSGVQIGASSEISAALKNFGYTTAEINEALRSLRGKELTTQEKIRLALKHLGK